MRWLLVAVGTVSLLGLLSCGVESDYGQDECQPECADRECGPDSCGGSCAPGCFGEFYCDVLTGKCQEAGCTPACLGRQCGPDGCGGSCQPGCGAYQVCDPASGRCLDDGCIPDCEGRVCGTDGCGGTCGPECPVGQVCNIIVGQCETVCLPQCEGKQCGPDGCGGWCPPGCGEESTCNEVTGKCGPIIPDCSGCPGVGDGLEQMRCAIELCDDEVYLHGEYNSPTGASTLGTCAAVNRFGSSTNDLAPLMNDSYALMATGPAVGTSHSQSMGGSDAGMCDPFSRDSFPINDVMEWRLRLKAPAGAHGFQIHYVFLSAEYDEYIGSAFNDKFYILIEAPSTNQGRRTVINYTACRDPDSYHDFICDDSMEYCDAGERYCYIAINTALSECCWYDYCPDGGWSTDLQGTGFSCASNLFTDSESYGSSTGWLVTEWVIEPEEEFDIIFHIHDTSDHILDSEVIIDKFLFVGSADPHTDPV